MYEHVGAQDNPRNQFQNSVRLALLKGLVDSSELVVKSVTTFWDKTLSVNTWDRLHQCLTYVEHAIASLKQSTHRNSFVYSVLYSADSSDQWVGNCVMLLLLLTVRSPDYNRVLFPPLTDTPFVEVCPAACRKSKKIMPWHSSTRLTRLEVVL